MKEDNSCSDRPYLEMVVFLSTSFKFYICICNPNPRACFTQTMHFTSPNPNWWGWITTCKSIDLQNREAFPRASYTNTMKCIYSMCVCQYEAKILCGYKCRYNNYVTLSIATIIVLSVLALHVMLLSNRHQRYSFTLKYIG